MDTKLRHIALTLFAALMLLGASPAFAGPVDDLVGIIGETIQGDCGGSTGGTGC